jgi:peptidoglycan/xylan/chitin deacetylase (PgdA/CDA1 family)
MWVWLKKKYKKSGNGGIVLMYHRVANLQYDPWNQAFDPVHFEEQIKYLQKNHTIVGLTEIQPALAEGAKNPIAITFENGYADNYRAAMPGDERKRAETIICKSAF